nr:MAG TPA: hypothetical protein [Bacteriophage sp.]
MVGRHRCPTQPRSQTLTSSGKPLSYKAQYPKGCWAFVFKVSMWEPKL